VRHQEWQRKKKKKREEMDFQVDDFVSSFLEPAAFIGY